MTPGIALIAVCACVSGELMATGGNPARGVLVNLTVGAASNQPHDPSRPTVVFVHGFNPVPGFLHFTMGNRFSEAMARRWGAGFNVLAWDWNAATYVGLHARRNEENCVRQGYALADALRLAGVAPERVHLIGHSSGCIVAAAATQRLFATGRGAVAQLTLLEPAEFYHDAVFERLAPWSSAQVVENYWAEGPSAFGKHAAYPGVRNWQVPTARPLLGVVSPVHSSHLEVLRWYFLTVEDPNCPAGFNASALLAVSS
ncbi:MAG: alpha/beta fold hydrolase [Isosphaeraceae bacterium]|nr:alpha/beta fold hydrolase [Isosphaeraceae bacterium]